MNESIQKENSNAARSTEVAATLPPPDIAKRSVSHYLLLDDLGRAIPLTEVDRQARAEALAKALAEMAAFPDDPPGSDEEFWRAIDEGRPERPLFRESYEP